MEQAGRRRGRGLGGIASLVAIIDEHGGALDYDLMTRTRFTLSDLDDGSLDWATLFHFTSNLDHESRLVRALHPELRAQFEWASGEHDAAIMADLIDAVNGLRYDFWCANTPKNRTKPRPIPLYPRPGMKTQETKGVRKIGAEPIPVSQFDEWWDSHTPEGVNET